MTLFVTLSYGNRIAALGDGAEKLYVSAAACESRHPSVMKYPTVELTVLKDLSQELADLFDLTLPIPFERQAHKTAVYQLAAEPHVTTHPRASLELLPERDYISML
jgi:hypothetical protein